MHEIARMEFHEKCLGVYCGRTVDEYGNFSSCGVSCLLLLHAASFMRLDGVSVKTLDS